jgi:hypothetical protein
MKLQLERKPRVADDLSEGLGAAAEEPGSDKQKSQQTTLRLIPVPKTPPP